MAGEENLSRIGWLYVGQDQVQKYLADEARLRGSYEALDRLGQGLATGPRSSAFANLNESNQSQLARTTLRDVDELTRAQLRLRDAELARLQVQKNLSISTPTITNAQGTFDNKYYNPNSPKFIGEWNYDDKGKKVSVNEAGSMIARDRADARSLNAIDAAAANLRNVTERVERLRNEAVRLQQATAAARASAQFEMQTNVFSRTGIEGLNQYGALESGRRAIAGVAKQGQTWAQYERELAKQAAEHQKAVEASATQRRSTLSSLYQVRRPELYTPSESAQQQSLYQQTRGQTYANPDQRNAVGRAQNSVNAAENALVRATMARTALIDKGSPSASALLASDNTLRAANARLEASRLRLAQAEDQAARSTSSSFRSNFATGFKGASDRPYAEQLGQAFKFSVFYGTAYKLLFALTQTFQQTLQEGIEFQSAMTELKIASGLSADAAEEMAQNLGEQATAAGAAPSQGVLLGARSLGLFGATEASGASAAEQERVATISARTALRLALGGKTDPALLQTQVAAVANAFGGGAQGQIRAADLDAYLGRRFGIVPGETIQAVAESGTVGQAAGFNQEEVFAIAAALQSRTGQSSSAVAGWMAQIFSRGGEGTLQQLTGRYGIDQTADLATQIEGLSRVYQTATNTERAEIAAGFGRGKVQNAAVVLLDEYPTIQREALEARDGSSGEADKIFKLRMADIGGQIQETTAVLKAFASELGQSGLLTVLGAGVVAIREFVQAATTLLQVWNQMPGVLRAAIAGLATLAIGARAASGSQMVWGAAGRFGAARAGGAGILGAGAAGAGAALPIAAAVGGLLAIAALKQSSDRMREAQDAASTALNNSGLDRDSGSSDYLGSATELDALATQNRDATGKLANLLTFGAADNQNLETADRLEAEAARRREVADAIDARTAANPVTPQAVSGFDADSIKTSLDLITDAGGTAETRLQALVTTLNGTGEAAIRASAAIDPDVFAGKLATQIRDGVAGIGRKVDLPGVLGDVLDAQGIKQAVTYRKKAGVTTGKYGAAQLYDEVGLNDVYTVEGGTLQDRLKAQLKEQGIGSVADINKETARTLAASLVEDSDFDVEGLDDGALDDARSRIVRMITRQLLGESKAWRELLKGNRDLTAQEVAAVVDSLNTEFDATLDNLPETDLGGRVANRQGKLRELMRVRKDTTADDLPSLFASIAKTRSEIAQAEIARLESVRRAQQQNATSAAGIRRAGMRSLRGQLRAAIRGGNQDDLAEVLSRAGAGSIDIARDMINRVREIAETAIRVRAAQAAVASAAGNIFAGFGALASSSEDIRNLLSMDELSDSLANATTGDGLTFSQGNDVEGTDKYFPEAKSKEDRAAEREAQRQEMLELRNNLYLLSIDMTDPLAMATAAVRDARRRLQSDIGSGQDRNTITASRIALRNAQAEREATAFQQRLSAVQTAEELGRISHRKYISYLESESKRLGAIKNRTYQQQQQLDEIDKLMKDAAESMQGQWNFGDIKLPTPYQVRRQVEQMRVDRATQLDAVSGRNQVTTTTINIDGADTGKVRQIIQQTLGSANSTVTTRPRRR